MPRDPRRELELLRDHGGPLGFTLWRTVSDVLLWLGCPPEDRFGLLHPPKDVSPDTVSYAALQAPEIADPLRVLRTVSDTPELAEASAVAEACAEIARWAEARGMKETAVQFAEAAARAEPDSSACAYTAGRLCRREGHHQRAAMWYLRAIRLSRRAQKRGVKGSEVIFANAHLGLGNLELELGNFEKSEKHYWKAVRAARRAGRHSLMGAAHHNLLLLMLARGQMAEAGDHAKAAVSLYAVGHPRFPLLAHDVALLWRWQGYFSSALPILERVLPWVERQRERILVLASLARCAAAVKDHIRFERAATEVLAMAAVDNEMADSSLYHVAEGARSFWEWERAESLAERALQLAQERKNAPVVALSRSLLEAIAAHRPGDVDIVPPQGGEVDAGTGLVLEKLEKQPAPELSPGAVPPERYPTE